MIAEPPDRLDYLDEVFGDPRLPDNLTGFRAFLDADERGQLLEPAELLLDDVHLDAEFVPARLGGRLSTADRLAHVLRPLFARDAALGLSHGTSNLIGAVTVWASGTPQQQRKLADVLLNNGWVAPGYTDMETGNDVNRTQMAAILNAEGVHLNGTKHMINNLERAELITVLARTGNDPGSRGHSLFLLDRGTLPRDRVRWHLRYRTAGVRGLPLAGMDLDNCPVPADSLVGETGGALEAILRGFQVTRCVLPSAAIGPWEVQLRTVLDFVFSRRLYGARAADLPHVQRVLSAAFVDLMIADAFSVTACRALHLLPSHTSCYAPAVKHVVPILLRESGDSLAAVLGARSLLRDGPYAIFQKHLRDIPVATLVHSGATVCLATIIPQLRRLARSWPDGGTEVPDGLFDTAAPLADLRIDQLRIVPGSGDPLIGVLARERSAVGDLRARILIDRLLHELGTLGSAMEKLRPSETALLASPTAFDLARRYTFVLAGAACLGMRRSQGSSRPGFNDAVLLLMLARICDRLGKAHDLDLRDAWASIWLELVDRHAEDRTFDMTARPLSY